MLHVEQHGDDVLLAVKAVPGAARDEIAGVLGERLKIRVSVAAERGMANRAIVRLLAKSIGIGPHRLSIEHGDSGPEKIIRIRNMTAEAVLALFR